MLLESISLKGNLSINSCPERGSHWLWLTKRRDQFVYGLLQLYVLYRPIGPAALSKSISEGSLIGCRSQSPRYLKRRKAIQLKRGIPSWLSPFLLAGGRFMSGREVEVEGPKERGDLRSSNITSRKSCGKVINRTLTQKANQSSYVGLRV